MKSSMIYLSIVFFLMTGCTEQQLERTDRIVADVNDIAAGGRAAIRSPAGDMIPQPAKGLAELALALVGAGVITYQNWRYSTMKKTAKAIVKGIEITERNDPARANPKLPVKSNIEAELKRLGIFDRADRLIDQLKVAR